MSAELLEQLAAGRHSGFERVVREYQHGIYAFALSMTGDPADAEEVAQDVFVRAHRALASYEPGRIRELRLSAWLHRIALNAVRNRVRRRTLRVVPLEPSLGIDPPSPEPGPEAQAERRELSLGLAHLVAGLPAHHREAVVLRCVQGLSYAEAAGLLGQPEGTVKSNVHRGLAALRRRLGALSEVS